MVLPVWNRVENKISEVLGEHFVLTEFQKLFGITSIEVPQVPLDGMNHLILLAKMCISKYKYGEHRSITELFEYEVTLRKWTIA